MHDLTRSIAPAAAASLALGAGLALLACMSPHRMTSGAVPDRTCPVPDGHIWYLPEDAGDNDRLESWCVTVGPEVIREHPSAPFAGLRAGEEITVLSWNVAAGGGDLLSFLRSEAGVECAGPQSALGRGAEHFALLVQEAFRRSAGVPQATDERVVPRAAVEESRPGQRLDIVDVAEQCGLSLVYAAAGRNGGETSGGMREDRGVAILSTLALADIWFMELPYEAARRVAVAATVRDASGRGLRLVNVHLTSAVPPARMLVTGNGSRLRQALAVADVLRQAEEAAAAAGSEAVSGQSTLLGGDLNTWSQSETALIHLRDAFPDSPPALGEPTRGAFPTDHILFRRGSDRAPLVIPSSYVRLEERHHSDHHGIRVRVRFPG